VLSSTTSLVSFRGGGPRANNERHDPVWVSCFKGPNPRLQIWIPTCFGMCQESSHTEEDTIVLVSLTSKWGSASHFTPKILGLLNLRKCLIQKLHKWFFNNDRKKWLCSVKCSEKQFKDYSNEWAFIFCHHYYYYQNQASIQQIQIYSWLLLLTVHRDLNRK
jgi:hypothetical protein